MDAGLLWWMTCRVAQQQTSPEEGESISIVPILRTDELSITFFVRPARTRYTTSLRMQRRAFLRSFAASTRLRMASALQRYSQQP